MNHFFPETAGFPIYGDDFKYINDGHIDFSEALIKAAGSDYFIGNLGITDVYNGVSSTVTVQAGYILLGGEVCKVDAQSIVCLGRPATLGFGFISDSHAASGHGCYWTKTLAVDTDGDRLKLNSAPMSPWRVRKATLNFAPLGTTGNYTQGTDGWEVNSPKSYGDVFSDLTKTLVNSYVESLVVENSYSSGDLLNSWSVGTGQTIHFKKERDGWVSFYMNVLGAGASDTHILTLPSAYRPANGVVKFLAVEGGNVSITGSGADTDKLKANATGQTLTVYGSYKSAF